MQIKFNIPHSDSWTADMKEQWLKDNVINPAVTSLSNSAMQEDSSPEEAKKFHAVARLMLMAQISVV